MLIFTIPTVSLWKSKVAIATKVLKQLQKNNKKKTTKKQKKTKTKQNKKQTIFLYRLILRTILQSFSFIPHIASEELIFSHFLANSNICCHGNQLKLRGLD